MFRPKRRILGVGMVDAGEVIHPVAVLMTENHGFSQEITLLSQR